MADTSTKASSGMTITANRDRKQYWKDVYARKRADKSFAASDTESEPDALYPRHVSQAI